MQVTENNAEGLKREYSVVIPAADMARRLDGKLFNISQNLNMPGFRPGKVPPNLVKKIHGESVMGEVLDEAVRESTEQLVKDKELRPAVQPKIEIKDYEEGADLTYDIAFELLPEIALPDFSKIKLERWIADIPDTKIEEVLNHLASQQKSFEDKGDGATAEMGDAAMIDFTGIIDGDEFDGGTAKGHQLELGSNSFLPGFEEQLIGVKAGDSRDVNVTFPDNYPAEPVAGKDAVFKVDVTAVKKSIPVEINDDLAKQVGMENLDALKDAVREQAVREHDNVSRARLKRSLLDELSDAEQFEVPQSMLDMEFQQIWAQVEQDMAQQGVEPDSDPKALDDMKDEYRNIANRRVRLGLLLAEEGRQNDIQVSQDDLSRALTEQARQYPGQERQVYEHFQNHPEAMAQLQAPLMEEKSVDFILELADVSELKVTHEELMAPPSDGLDDSPAEKPKKKSKPAAKKKSKASEKKEKGAATKKKAATPAKKKASPAKTKSKTADKAKSKSKAAGKTKAKKSADKS